MRYAPEPAAGAAPRTAVLLCNLGTPDEPTPAAVKRYLAEFLGDPRVVEIPPALWQPILRGVILQVRPAKSAAKYRSIWMPEGSPLRVWTDRQAAHLEQALAERGRPTAVRVAMRYGNPAIAATLDALKAEGATHVLVLPLYPQYAGATTGSVVDAVAAWARRTRAVPELRFVNRHHDDAGYIEALERRVRTHWQHHGQAERLVLSFHGIPARSITLGDPYQRECETTARLLRERLGLGPDRVLTTYQSRFGKARWLEPYTEPTLQRLAREGVRSAEVFCPGFVADCLETLEEIGQEVRDAFLAAGGTSFRHIPCLNDDPAWIDALAELALRHLRGWPGAPSGVGQPARREAVPT